MSFVCPANEKSLFLFNSNLSVLSYILPNCSLVLFPAFMSCRVVLCFIQYIVVVNLMGKQSRFLLV